MRSKAAIKGHPLHPILVTVPLGAVPLALVFDILVYADTLPWGPPASVAAWTGAAFVTLILATAVLLVGAIPGFIDYATVTPREGAVWRLANVHMVLGLATAVVLVASTVVHGLLLGETAAATGHAWALGIDAVAVGMMGVQGFLGGEMVFKGRVGVTTAREERERTEEAGEARPAHGGTEA